MHESEHDLVATLEADLVAIAAADADLERDAEVAERTRIERTAIALLDRVRATGTALEVTTFGGDRLAGVVRDTGADWVLLAPVVATAAHEHLVRMGSVAVVRGLGRAASSRRSPVAARPLASVLRAWCRDRSTVDVRLVDRSVLSGLATAAYADHLDVVTPDGPLSLPYAAIAVLSR